MMLSCLIFRADLTVLHEPAPPRQVFLLRVDLCIELEMLALVDIRQAQDQAMLRQVDDGII